MTVPEKTTVTYMTPVEVRKVINTIKSGKGRYKKYINRDVAIVEIGCSIGLRVSAIVNIDIEDIDMENNKMYVIEKGKKGRNVYFGDNTKESILTWISDRREITGNDTGALFISKNKTRMSRDAVSDMLKSAVKEAGIEKRITPHKMRSTCAMNLYQKKGDIYLVQQQLGHKNIENTMIYAKATENQMIEAAAALDSIF
jgi:site-specific recombinase XerD